MSAIVTGGTRGIGFAIARALLADGRPVTITGRDRGRVDRAVEQLGGADRLAGEVVDVRDREAVDRLFQAAVRRFGKVDVLLTPTTPGPAFGIGEVAGDPLQMYLNGIFTVTVNMAGLPGISVPAGLSGEGTPMGLQLIGKPFDEGTLFRTAQVIESAAGRFPVPERWWA